MNKRSTILLIPILCALLSGCWDLGTGEKIGSITRLQKTGAFCKTWEGISQRGGINNGSGVMGGEFHFTVEDEALAKKVLQAMEAQQEVKLSFRKEAFTWCRSDSNNVFVTGIEPLNAISVPPPQSKEVTGIAPAKPNDITVELLKQNQAILNELKAQCENQKK
jgi:hypothetical protein